MSLCTLSLTYAEQEARETAANSPTNAQISTSLEKTSTEEPAIVNQYGEQMVAATMNMDDVDSRKYLQEAV